MRSIMRFIMSCGKYNDEDSKQQEERDSEPGGCKPVPVACS